MLSHAKLSIEAHMQNSVDELRKIEPQRRIHRSDRPAATYMCMCVCVCVRVRVLPRPGFSQEPCLDSFGVGNSRALMRRGNVKLWGVRVVWGSGYERGYCYGSINRAATRRYCNKYSRAEHLEIQEE